MTGQGGRCEAIDNPASDQLQLSPPSYLGYFGVLRRLKYPIAAAPKHPAPSLKHYLLTLDLINTVRPDIITTVKQTILTRLLVLTSHYIHTCTTFQITP